MIETLSQQTEPWLYLKIYTGTRFAENLLKVVLYPYWIDLRVKSTSNLWFFIRYSDPDFHLRFRLKFSNDSACSSHLDIISGMLYKMKISRSVWKVNAASYVPEYERYGRQSMEMAEKIFCADSNAFMQYLSLDHDLDEHARWLYSIASINRLLDDFAYTFEGKKDLLLEMNRSFGKEFGKDRKLAAQLSERYRKYRGHIRELLIDAGSPFDEILFKRSMEHSKAVSAICKLYEAGKMDITQNTLLSSFIHMSMNRIFRNNNRLHEMVIYDLLFRAYKESFHRSSSSKL